jgi:PAS domain S-box-containing protein
MRTPHDQRAFEVIKDTPPKTGTVEARNLGADFGEEIFRFVFEQSLVGMSLSDSEGRLIRVNEQFHLMFGYPPDALHGKPFEELVHPDDLDDCLAFQQAVRSGAKDHDTSEKRCVRKNGDAFHARLSIHGVRTYDERVRFFLTMIEDITNRIETEARLQANAVELEQKNIALKVLLDNRKQEKHQQTDKILKNFENMVFPYYARLKKAANRKDMAALLEIVEHNTIKSLAPLETPMSRVYRSFSPMEIQVADLIKTGKTSKEIAAMLHTSLRTVFFHRHNIRRKLHIENTKINLHTFLADHT